jgi:hypothetical protein
MQWFLQILEQAMAIAYYWIWIFWRAVVATYSIVADRPVRSAIFALLAALVIVGLATWDKKPVMDELRPWLVGLVVIAMATFFVFVFELVLTPARVYEEQTKQISKLDRRLSFAMGELPEHRLTDDQKEQFRQMITSFAPSDVIIDYIYEPHSRSSTVAEMLQKIFQSAGWKVTLKKSTFDELPVNGIALRISDTNLSEEQQAVVGAFQAVNMRCSPRGFERVDVPDRRVELVIGQL